jgi:hypothetical protein
MQKAPAARALNDEGRIQSGINTGNSVTIQFSWIVSWELLAAVKRISLKNIHHRKTAAKILADEPSHHSTTKGTKRSISVWRSIVSDIRDCTLRI